mgnify:CR=1 FL=1
MKIYNVIHIHNICDCGNCDIKSIGYFSTYERACAIIDRRKSVSGFSAYPNEFIVTECNLETMENLRTIYVLWIAVHDEQYSCDFEQTISIHSNHHEGMIAKENFMKMNANCILKSKFVTEINLSEETIDFENSWLYGFDADE